MAKATGEVVECPTQEIPFMAVISTEGKIIQERFFASRPEAEAFLVVTLKELAKTDAQGKTKALPRKANARGKVIETPTQDMPFKAVISTEGKIVQERFFASARKRRRSSSTPSKDCPKPPNAADVRGGSRYV